MEGNVCIPFSGLGFDLSAVKVGRIRFAGRTEEHACAVPRHRMPVMRPFGYDLLLNLSREIRGR